MSKSLVMLELVKEKMFIVVVIILTIMIFLCLYHAIKGPRVADRLVSINMMGTIVIVIIAIIALLKKEGYIIDICMIYAMISFLAVIVLTKVYMGVYREEKRKLENNRKEKQNNGSI